MVFLVPKVPSLMMSLKYWEELQEEIKAFSNQMHVIDNKFRIKL